MGAEYRQHAPYATDGHAGIAEWVRKFKESFPQHRYEVKKVIAEGDLVVLHLHGMNGPNPHGESVVDIFRIEDGKVVEHWDVIQPIPETRRQREHDVLMRVPISVTPYAGSQAIPRGDAPDSGIIAPAKGIPEDPVTGSAHCSLVPFWARRLGKTSLRVFQPSARGGVLRLAIAERPVLLAHLNEADQHILAAHPGTLVQAIGHLAIELAFLLHGPPFVQGHLNDDAG